MKLTNYVSYITRKNRGVAPNYDEAKKDFLAMIRRRNISHL
jgi:hypothetical protein